MSSIGKTIKKHRSARGMTQDQLAAHLNVTRQAVSNWETGKTQPDIGTLTALAAFFEIPVEELIYGSRKKPASDADAPAQGDGISGAAVFFGVFIICFFFLLVTVGFWLSNAWWLMAFIALVLAGGITALYFQQEKIDMLEERITRLESKLQ